MAAPMLQEQWPFPHPGYNLGRAGAVCSDFMLFLLANLLENSPWAQRGAQIMSCGRRWGHSVKVGTVMAWSRAQG